MPQEGKKAPSLKCWGGLYRSWAVLPVGLRFPVDWVHPVLRWLMPSARWHNLQTHVLSTCRAMEREKHRVGHDTASSSLRTCQGWTSGPPSPRQLTFGTAPYLMVEGGSRQRYSFTCLGLHHKKCLVSAPGVPCWSAVVGKGTRLDVRGSWNWQVSAHIDFPCWHLLLSGPGTTGRGGWTSMNGKSSLGKW